MPLEGAEQMIWKPSDYQQDRLDSGTTAFATKGVPPLCNASSSCHTSSAHPVRDQHAHPDLTCHLLHRAHAGNNGAVLGKLGGLGGSPRLGGVLKGERAWGC